MNTAFENQDRLTVAETAKYLRISKASLDAWRSQRKGPPFLKIGHRVFYRKNDLDAFMAASLVTPA